MRPPGTIISTTQQPESLMAPRKTKTVQEKADAAEQRSGKAPKSHTTKAKAADAPSQSVANDDLDRGLFLEYMGKLAFANEAVKTAKDALAVIYKQANQDGFHKKDFEVARKLQGLEGEKAKKAEIERSLKIARWLGLSLGTQLDMFAEPDRVPAVDVAFELGKTQGLAGITAKPDYSPDTEQYRRYMEGWHTGQGIRSKGFKKLHPEVQKDQVEKAAKADQRAAQQAEDAKAFDAPASGVAMTRADFEKQKAQQQDQKPN